MEDAQPAAPTRPAPPLPLLPPHLSRLVARDQHLARLERAQKLIFASSFLYVGF